MGKVVRFAAGGRGCAIEVRREVLGDDRFVELLDRYFGVAPADFSVSRMRPSQEAGTALLAGGDLCAKVRFGDDSELSDMFEFVSMCRGWTHIRAADESTGFEICFEHDEGAVEWGFGFCGAERGGAEQPLFFSVGGLELAPGGRMSFSWEMHDCFGDAGSWSGRIDDDGRIEGFAEVDLPGGRIAADGDFDSWDAIRPSVGEWMREAGTAAGGMRRVWRDWVVATCRIDALRDGRLANMG